MSRKQLDSIVKANTAFASFDELVFKTARAYRPSLDQRNPDLVLLADAYDEAQLLRGDARRAYRYGEPATTTAHRPGTVIIGGFHATLGFETERDGSVVSSCHVSRHGQASSLGLIEDLGAIDGDNGPIPVPDRVIEKIAAWAVLRGY